MSKFQTKHYEQVAIILGHAIANENEDSMIYSYDLVQEFVEAFKSDNPRFKEQLFRGRVGVIALRNNKFLKSMT